MTLTQKGTRASAAAATAKDILESDPKSVASGEKEKRRMEIWRARSARKPSQNGLDGPSNCPCATRTKKVRTKKNMSVPL